MIFNIFNLGTGKLRTMREYMLVDLYDKMIDKKDCTINDGIETSPKKATKQLGEMSKETEKRISIDAVAPHTAERKLTRQAIEPYGINVNNLPKSV